MSWGERVEAALWGEEDCEPFRELLPEAQRERARLVSVEVYCYADADGGLSATVRFVGIRVGDGKPYARPANHWVRELHPDWLPYAFKNPVLLSAARQLQERPSTEETG